MSKFFFLFVVGFFLPRFKKGNMLKLKIGGVDCGSNAIKFLYLLKLFYGVAIHRKCLKVQINSSRYTTDFQHSSAPLAELSNRLTARLFARTDRSYRPISLANGGPITGE